MNKQAIVIAQSAKNAVQLHRGWTASILLGLRICGSLDRKRI